MEAFVARIIPDPPKGSPRRITFGRVPDGQRKTFDVHHGFVSVDAEQVPFLQSIYANGEPLERGGRGPKLFEVVTVAEAEAIVAAEERAKLLHTGGSGLIHADLRSAMLAGHAHARMERNAGIAGPDKEPQVSKAAAPAEATEAQPVQVAATKVEAAAKKVPRVGRKRPS